MHQLAEKLSHIELAAVAELKALLGQQYGIRDIRLFGSKARGTGHAESDLDLFIVVPDLDWERAKAIYTLCFELSLHYDLLIAPTLCSQAELENPLVQATPFHRAIQEEGLPVWARSKLHSYAIALVRRGETLEEAQLLARESRWRGALNRVYYAMFYATLALLAVKQLAASRHSGVIALFHREFVRPGLFAREWARYLDIAFNLRNRSDYQDFIAPDVVQVEELLEAAESFITEAERLSQQLLTQQNE